jgi:hypothetical protein
MSNAFDIEEKDSNQQKFETLKSLATQLHMFFTVNEDTMPYMTSTRHITSWLQSLANLEALSIRDKLSGSIQMNAFLNTLNISRNFVYDRAHTLCFEQQRPDVCKQLLKMITEIDFRPLEDEKLNNDIFLPCKILYQNPQAKNEEKIAVCMKSWVTVYDVLTQKAKTLKLILQELMGTSWILERANIVEESKKMFNQNLKESLHISEKVQKEDFYFLRDMAVVLTNTNATIQQDIAGMDEKLQSIQFEFKTTLEPIQQEITTLSNKIFDLNQTVNDLPEKQRTLVRQIMNTDLLELKQEMKLIRETKLPEILQNIVTIRTDIQSQSEQQHRIDQLLNTLTDPERKVAENIITLSPEEIKQTVQNMMDQRIRVLLTDIAIYKTNLESAIGESNATRQELLSIQQRINQLPEQLQQQTQLFFQQSTEDMKTNISKIQHQTDKNQTNISQLTAQITDVKNDIRKFNKHVNEKFATLNRIIPEQMKQLQHQFDQKIAEIETLQLQLREQINTQIAPTEIKQIIQDLDLNESPQITQQITAFQSNNIDTDMKSQINQFAEMEKKLQQLQETLKLQGDEQRAEIIKYKRMQYVYILFILILTWFIFKLYAKMNCITGKCTQDFYTA